MQNTNHVKTVGAWLLVTTTVTTAAVAAQSSTASRWPDAVGPSRQIMRAALADQKLPGLSVAVGVGNDIVWAEGFGWADIKAEKPIRPDTRFWIGTASTMLTSAGYGVLAEDGRLKLDEQIRTYDMVRNVGPQFGARCERPLDAVSAAMEDAAGQPFRTFMRERVFQPLGMTHTGADSAKDENPEDIGGPGEDAPFMTAIHDLILVPLGIASRREPPRDRATFYAPGWGPKAVISYWIHPTHPRNLSCYAGSMAFLSTPSDLVRFSIVVNGGRLLRPATLQSLPALRRSTAGGEVLGHQVMTMARKEKTVVVVMANATYANTSAVAAKIAEAFAER